MPSKHHPGESALMVWISEELHQKFKLYCVHNRTTIKEVVITFIQSLVEVSNGQRKNKEDSGENEKK